jgi:hypothetical protein
VSFIIFTRTSKALGLFTEETKNDVKYEIPCQNSREMIPARVMEGWAYEGHAKNDGMPWKALYLTLYGVSL